MKKQKNITSRKCCDNCDNCLYICEGDSICTESSLPEPKFVMDDWQPTDDYLWCKGEHWI